MATSKTVEMLFFCRTPLFPSKKNGWGPGSTVGRRIRLDPAVKLELDRITLLLQSAKQLQCTPTFTRVSVDLALHISGYRGVDPDNQLGGLMDCLTNAGVIADDSLRHIVRESLSVKRCEPGTEHAFITVTGDKYVVPTTKRKSAPIARR